MKKITLITILIATFATKSFAYCPIPQWCPTADLHQVLCPGEPIDDIEFPSVIGKTLIINWWTDETRVNFMLNPPPGITVSSDASTPLGEREYAWPVSIKGAPTVAGTYHYTVSNTCGVELLHGSITVVGPPTIGTVTPNTDQATPQNIPFPSTLTFTDDPIGMPPITVQWFSNTTASNSGGTNLGTANGAQTATFTPPSDVVNTTGVYYYAVATDRCGSTTATINTSGKHIVLPATGCDLVTGSRDSVTITSADFATAQTWSPGTSSLVWSDAVISPQCTPRGDSYNGGSTNNYNVDCRAPTNGFDGHYFSWCAVMKYADILCPGTWRVPTTAEFLELHQSLGHAAPATQTGSVPIIADTYMGIIGTGGPDGVTENHGGSWGGSRFNAYAGSLSSTDSNYWSSSEDSTTSAFDLRYSASNVYPQHTPTKTNGFALRCVR